MRTLVPFIVLQGAANGMATLARATSLAEIFGARHYGAIAGAVALGSNGARAVGPVGASLLSASARTRRCSGRSPSRWSWRPSPS